MFIMQQMSKKRSIQLKTVDVAQMISIKTHLPKPSHHTISVEPQYKTSIRPKTQSSANFGNLLKLAKRQEAIRHKIDNLVKESQISPIKQNSQRLSLKQFPKRERSIKNSNPYRYFLPTKSERLPTQDKAISEPVLHFSLNNILKEKMSIKLRCKFIGNRAVTEADNCSSNRKNLGRKNSSSRKKSTEGANQQIQPWLLTENYQSNNHPIPYFK